MWKGLRRRISQKTHNGVDSPLHSSASDKDSSHDGNMAVVTTPVKDDAVAVGDTSKITPSTAIMYLVEDSDDDGELYEESSVSSDERENQRRPMSSSRPEFIQDELEALRVGQLARNLRKDLLEAESHNKSVPLVTAGTESFLLKQKEQNRQWKKEQEDSRNYLSSYRGAANSGKNESAKTSKYGRSHAAPSGASSEMDTFYLQQKAMNQKLKQKQRDANAYLHSYRGYAIDKGQQGDISYDDLVAWQKQAAAVPLPPSPTSERGTIGDVFASADGKTPFPPIRLDDSPSDAATVGVIGLEPETDKIGGNLALRDSATGQLCITEAQTTKVHSDGDEETDEISHDKTRCHVLESNDDQPVDKRDKNGLVAETTALDGDESPSEVHLDDVKQEDQRIQLEDPVAPETVIVLGNDDDDDEDTQQEDATDFMKKSIVKDKDRSEKMVAPISYTVTDFDEVVDKKEEELEVEKPSDDKEKEDTTAAEVVVAPISYAVTELDETVDEKEEDLEVEKPSDDIEKEDITAAEVVVAPISYAGTDLDVAVDEKEEELEVEKSSDDIEKEDITAAEVVVAPISYAGADLDVAVDEKEEELEVEKPSDDKEKEVSTAVEVVTTPISYAVTDLDKAVGDTEEALEVEKPNDAMEKEDSAAAEVVVAPISYAGADLDEAADETEEELEVEKPSDAIEKEAITAVEVVIAPISYAVADLDKAVDEKEEELEVEEPNDAMEKEDSTAAEVVVEPISYAVTELDETVDEKELEVEKPSDDKEKEDITAAEVTDGVVLVLEDEAIEKRKDVKLPFEREGARVDEPNELGDMLDDLLGDDAPPRVEQHEIEKQDDGGSSEVETSVQTMVMSPSERSSRIPRGSATKSQTRGSRKCNIAAPRATGKSDSPSVIASPQERIMAGPRPDYPSQSTNSTASGRGSRHKSYQSPRKTQRYSPQKSRRPADEPPVACTDKWSFDIHNNRDGCDHCLDFASPSEKRKFEEDGHHYRINRVRSGCSRSCPIFPRKDDEPPVRLCRKCFHDTHRPAKA
jgi:hypothetical protein